MTEIILGRDFLENEERIEGIIPEFFALIDPEGTNVILDKSLVKGGYHCNCLFKFVGMTEPFEADFYLSEDMYKQIVYSIDINSLLGEVH